MQQTIDGLAAMQNELYEVILIGNWLAVVGRLLEICIGIMLALVLVRLNELCRRAGH